MTEIVPPVPPPSPQQPPQPQAQQASAPLPPSPQFAPPPPKDPGLALILELVPGFFLQTFGIGNLYAGNLGWGVALMLGYWVAAFVNTLLCFVLIGFVTWPLTWCAFAFLAGCLAVDEARRKQAQWQQQWQPRA